MSASQQPPCDRTFREPWSTEPKHKTLQEQSPMPPEPPNCDPRKCPTHAGDASPDATLFSVATVWQLPFVIAARAGEGLIERGRLSFHGMSGWTFVSPGYFDVFHIPVLRGRDFALEDDARAPAVAIINEALARQYWPNGDPLNDRLIIGRGMRAAYTEDPIRQIIGIGNVRDTGLTRTARPAIYVPMAQVPDGVTVANAKLLPIVWIARTAGDPYGLSAPMERALESTTGLPVGRVRAMRDVMSESTAHRQFD